MFSEPQSQITGVYSELSPPTYESLVYNNGTTNNALDVYESITEQQTTSPGNEYTYAKPNGVNPITGRPLPSAPACEHDYSTLEVSDNPRMQHYTDLKTASNDPKPDYASLENLNKPDNAFDSLSQNKKDKPETRATNVDPIGSTGTHTPDHNYAGDYSSVGDQIPSSEALPRNDVYSYATNDQVRSLSDVYPSPAPPVYSTLDDTEGNNVEQDTKQEYATLEESNSKGNGDEKYVTVLGPDEKLAVKDGKKQDQNEK